MIVQGGGCGSIDNPLAGDVGPNALIWRIAGQGYVTTRVDKSGVGDSQGPPCEQIGYTQEREGYQATLEALRRDPRVDPSRVFLLGISLGGVFAPILAAETPVRHRRVRDDRIPSVTLCRTFGAFLQRVRRRGRRACLVVDQCARPRPTWSIR
jgi:pimeloyl-ACP methyl ester carboxylesterase